MLPSEIDLTEVARALGVELMNARPEPLSGGGGHSCVYACETHKGEMVLRIARGKQGFYTDYFPGLALPDNWLTQDWPIHAARIAGIPSPEIVASSRSLGAILMRRLPGTPIDSRYDEVWAGCPYDEADFGRILRKLHSIAPTGWGPIDDFGQCLFSTWSEFLERAAESALKTCQRRASLPKEVLTELETKWLPHLSTVEFGPPALLHMESLGFANILYDPSSRQVTGLIDYEDCLGGDPLFELVWMRFYFGHEGPDQCFFDFDRFFSGYGPMDQDDGRAQLYEPFPFLDKLRWIPPDSERARKYTRTIRALLARL